MCKSANRQIGKSGLELLQDLADDEGFSIVESGGEGGFVPLAGPDALDGVDDVAAVANAADGAD